MNSTQIDTVSCFVIMPFGVKVVAGLEVDFDAVYREVFVPAIEAVPVDDGWIRISSAPRRALKAQ